MSITANETLLGRTTEALSEALYMASHSDHWQRETCRTMLSHAAAELIAMEQHAGRPLTLQDAARFLARGAEGRA